MPRKKVVKRAARKKQQSKQATKNLMSPLQKIEKDFSEAPARLTVQLTKEVAALKQKEAKLNTTITKIQSQISKIEKSITVAKRTKTATGKRQLAAVKKALNDTKKDYALSIAALKETRKSLADAEISLARIIALVKAMKQFDKTWANQAKLLKEKAKSKGTKKPKAKKTAKPKAKSGFAAPTVEKLQPPALTVIEQPDYDSSADEAELDDAKQATF